MSKLEEVFVRLETLELTNPETKRPSFRAGEQQRPALAPWREADIMAMVCPTEPNRPHTNPVYTPTEKAMTHTPIDRSPILVPTPQDDSQETPRMVMWVAVVVTGYPVMEAD